MLHYCPILLLILDRIHGILSFNLNMNHPPSHHHPNHSKIHPFRIPTISTSSPGSFLSVLLLPLSRALILVSFFRISNITTISASIEIALFACAFYVPSNGVFSSAFQPTRFPCHAQSWKKNPLLHLLQGFFCLPVWVLEIATECPVFKLCFPYRIAVTLSNDIILHCMLYSVEWFPNHSLFPIHLFTVIGTRCRHFS